MTQDRRDFLRFIGATGLTVAAAPLLANSASAAPSAVRTAPSFGDLKVGYLPITDASPLLIAHANGTFADKGFDVANPTRFASWPALTEAFLAKQVDVVHLLMPLALQLKFGQKQNIKILAWNHTNGSALTVANTINKVKDLAGKTVAIPLEYSLHNVVLQQILKANNLKPIFTGNPSASRKTVKLVVLAPAEMPAALAGGSIQGYIVADPFNALAETRGVGKVLRFTGDVWREHACCVTVVRGDLVKDSPKAAQALVDSIATAQLAIRKNRRSAANKLTEYLPQGFDAIEKALLDYDEDAYGKAIQHPEWLSKRIGFQPYPFESYTKELVKQLKSTKFSAATDTTWLKNLNALTAHDRVVALGLAEKAIKKVGGVSEFGLPASLTRKEIIKP